MKKIILVIFLLVSSLMYGRTTASWGVEERFDGKITVTCELNGDIFHYFNVEVDPFNSLLADGSDSDFSTGIKLIVEKDVIRSNKKVVYYECYLEKDFEKLATFYFRVRNQLIIETM